MSTPRSNESETQNGVPRSMRPAPSPVHGLVVTFGIAAVAAVLGARFPIVGGPVIGIVLGMIVKLTGTMGPRHGPGIAFSARQLLQYSIVFLARA